MTSHAIVVLTADETAEGQAESALRSAQELGVELVPDWLTRRGNQPISPEETIRRLRTAEAVLRVGKPAGAGAGLPGIDPIEGTVFALRHLLNVSVNVRTFHAADQAGESVTVVRELSGGPYAKAGGAVHVGDSDEVAVQESVETRTSVSRCVRHAFHLARATGNSLLFTHKVSVLRHTGGLWQRVVDELADEFPDVAVTYLDIDAACARAVEAPFAFPVVVADNLFGDILSDVLGAATQASWYSASSEINLQGGASIFEPMHEAGLKIPAAKASVAPLLSIHSAVSLLLDQLGEDGAAATLRREVLSVVASSGVTTPEQLPLALATLA